jgi:hypothetical protein
MNTKIRAIVVSLIAAGSFAAAGIAPVAAQADSPASLERAGYTCTVYSDEISCSNGFHLFTCTLSDCELVYLEHGGPTLRPVSKGLLKPTPVVTAPPVVRRVTPAPTLKLAS